LHEHLNLDCKAKSIPKVSSKNKKFFIEKLRGELVGLTVF